MSVLKSLNLEALIIVILLICHRSTSQSSSACSSTILTGFKQSTFVTQFNTVYTLLPYSFNNRPAYGDARTNKTKIFFCSNTFWVVAVIDDLASIVTTIVTRNDTTGEVISTENVYANSSYCRNITYAFVQSQALTPQDASSTFGYAENSSSRVIMLSSIA
eukprot:PhF_6_TR26645/c0_g1_i2/m.38611